MRYVCDQQSLTVADPGPLALVLGVLPTIRLSPLGSPIIRKYILNHLLHSKDVECILMFLIAMPRGVSVAHIYVLKVPLHHL